MDAFRRGLVDAAGRELPTTAELHRWAVEDPDAFWSEVWERCGVVGDRGATAVQPAEDLREVRFFPEARLSLAENLLAAAADRPGEPAVLFADEAGNRSSVTWERLVADVAAMAAALRTAGVGRGDVVAAWVPNVPDALTVMLAAAAVGAIFTSTSSDFGPDGVVDRFGQVEPVVLVAADGYRYNGKPHDCLDRLAGIRERLPSVRETWVIGHLEAAPDLSGTPGARLLADVVAEHAGAAPSYERLPFEAPGFVLYSSGTSGPPKAIVHRGAGVLLKLLPEHQLHTDLGPGDRAFWFTTLGWMMWNWLVVALASGATVVLYDGSPFAPGPAALWDLVDELGITMLGVSAKWVDACRKAGLRPRDTHSLASLRTIGSTGSPLAPSSFEWVYDAVADDVHLASVAGGTDICGGFVGGDPTRPVFSGEIQCAILGLDVDVADLSGAPLPSGQGELVCRNAFPSVPLGFWGDDGSRFSAAYFERVPGVWAQGDFAEWTPNGGMVISGRSDATLNAGGVRIGTAEIYRQVERFDEVAEALAVGQPFDGDTRIVLFVRLAPDAELDDDLRQRIATRLRTECSPRHVPARTVAVDDLPRTRSNKIAEMAVGDVLAGREVRNVEALANPEALELFRDLPELQD
jgi:acetoacetyl-CoA synthetase